MILDSEQLADFNQYVKNIFFTVLTEVMAESIVTDWLSDYASLQAFEIRSFASQHEHNHEIAHALFTILNERLKYPDVSNWYSMASSVQVTNVLNCISATPLNLQSVLQLLSIAGNCSTKIYIAIRANFNLHLSQFGCARR